VKINWKFWSWFKKPTGVPKDAHLFWRGPQHTSAFYAEGYPDWFVFTQDVCDFLVATLHLAPGDQFYAGPTNFPGALKFTKNAWVPCTFIHYVYEGQTFGICTDKLRLFIGSVPDTIYVGRK